MRKPVFLLSANNKDADQSDQHILICCFCLFVFVALRPKSTAMVMVGQSVHLTTLFSWASLDKPITSTLCTYLLL